MSCFRVRVCLVPSVDVIETWVKPPFALAPFSRFQHPAYFPGLLSVFQHFELSRFFQTFLLRHRLSQRVEVCAPVLACAFG